MATGSTRHSAWGGAYTNVSVDLDLLLQQPFERIQRNWVASEDQKRLRLGVHGVAGHEDRLEPA